MAYIDILADIDFVGNLNSAFMGAILLALVLALVMVLWDQGAMYRNMMAASKYELDPEPKTKREWPQLPSLATVNPIEILGWVTLTSLLMGCPKQPGDLEDPLVLQEPEVCTVEIVVTSNPSIARSTAIFRAKEKGCEGKIAGMTIAKGGGWLISVN